MIMLLPWVNCQHSSLPAKVLEISSTIFTSFFHQFRIILELIVRVTMLYDYPTIFELISIRLTEYIHNWNVLRWVCNLFSLMNGLIDLILWSLYLSMFVLCFFLSRLLGFLLRFYRGRLLRFNNIPIPSLSSSSSASSSSSSYSSCTSASTQITSSASASA